MIRTCKIFDVNEYIIIVVGPFADSFAQIKNVGETSNVQI